MSSPSESTAKEIPYLALTNKSRAQRIFLPFISSTGYCTPDLTLKIDFCWNLMLCNSFLLPHRKTEGR